uniref:Uncharacterized protein n=1 Tax=Arundo donax TaxID=35708 RepID=A0A0A9FU27_ARUDO
MYSQQLPVLCFPLTINNIINVTCRMLVGVWSIRINVQETHNICDCLVSKRLNLGNTITNQLYS